MLLKKFDMTQKNGYAGDGKHEADGFRGYQQVIFTRRRFKVKHLLGQKGNSKDSS